MGVIDMKENIKIYEKMQIMDLVRFLDDHIYQNPKKYLKILSDLKKSMRYFQDADFYLLVNSYLIRVNSLLNNYNDALEIIKNVSEIFSEKENHHLVCIFYYFVSSIYSYLYLHIDNLRLNLKIISYEKENNYFTNATAIAYNNIADIFERTNNYPIALEYYLKSLNSVREDDTYRQDYKDFKFFVLLNIANIYLLIGKQENALNYIEKSKKLLTKNPNFYYIYMLNVTNLSYYGITRNKEKLIESYFLSRKHSLKTSNFKYDLWHDIIKLYEFYKEGLVDEIIMEKEFIFIDSLTNIELYSEVYLKFYECYIEFFSKKADQKYVKKAYEKYFKLYNEFEKSKKYYRKLSITFHDEIIKIQEENRTISEKKSSLNFEKENLIMKEKTLDDISFKLSKIKKTSQNVLEFSNENDAIDNIYKEIKDILNIPMDSFLIFMLEDDNKLHMKYLLENNKKVSTKEDISLSLSEDANVIRAFKTGKIINMQFTSEDRIKYHLSGETEIKSAIFLPLCIKGKSTGVLSIQALKENAYSDVDIKSLKLLLPFYAISIQFAREKELLEKKINYRKKQNEKLEKITKKLEKISKLDSLTGIMNRRTFEEEFQKMIAISNYKNLPLNCYMFDIDNFKIYNDTHGHLLGDDALIKISNSIKEFFKSENSMFARYGGEEFIAIEIGLDEKSAIEKGNKIVESIKNLNIENNSVPEKMLTVSTGLAISNLTIIDSNFIINIADNNLYRAKNSGKNKICYSTLN